MNAAADTATEKAEHEKQKKIHITVTTTGDDFEDDFQVNQPLLVVKQRAVAVVGGGAQSANFRLEYNGKPLLNEHEKIGTYAETLGWGDCVELELVPNPEVI